ncbi:MAG TPA: hypothetical protein DF715_08245 [Oceanicaulis sp.]|nr:hypothetical protein [Oceanicaulis sp.]
MIPGNTVMQIRDYQVADAATLVGIFRSAVLEGSAPLYTAEQRKAWASRIASGEALHERLKDQTCLVAIGDSGALGFTALQVNGHLDMLFVLPGQRRSGTAGALHDALLERAASAGHAGLSVHASHLARRFLAKRGWQFVRTETVNLHGVTLEHHYMTLQLGQAGKL